MKHFKLLLSTLILINVVGCISNTATFFSENSEEVNEQGKDQVAVLTDYQLKDGYIVIQAVGYGCTFFNSFKVALADKKANALEVIRTRPDECGMKPRNVSLQYSFKHLGLDLDKDIQVKNPLRLSHKAQ